MTVAGVFIVVVHHFVGIPRAATTAPRYVNEFCGRHNVRDLDTIVQMTGVVLGLVGKRLQYQDLVAGTRGVAT